VSRFAYDASEGIADTYDLETLLMAAMRRADPVDLDRLREAFPRLHNEFSACRSAEQVPGPVKS
jgi:hypothetical protein